MPDKRLFVDGAAMLSGMNKTFFVDIDQTISTGYVGRDLPTSVQYYRDLGVVVPDGITSWPALFQLPDVARQHEVLPGAQDGVCQLAQRGALFYATARKSDVHQITLDWLRREGFPLPDQVIFCEGVSEKLVSIASHAGPLVLVDDRWYQLLGILESHGNHRSLRGLCQRFTLVAFGACRTDVPISSVIPVVPLPDWSGLTELLKSEMLTDGAISRTGKDVL